MHVRIQRGAGDPDPPPLENHKKIYVFFSNTGPDPHKIVKLPSQLSILGHIRHASETPFKWRLLAGRKWPANNGIWIIPPPQTRTPLSRLDPL